MSQAQTVKKTYKEGWLICEAGKEIAGFFDEEPEHLPDPLKLTGGGIAV